MCSFLCLVLWAILLLIGLFVLAAVILWCETFQVKSRANASGADASSATVAKTGGVPAAVSLPAVAVARPFATAAGTPSSTAPVPVPPAVSLDPVAVARPFADGAKASKKALAAPPAAVHLAPVDVARPFADGASSPKTAAAPPAAVQLDPVEVARPFADTASADADGDGLPDIDTATPEQAAAAFRADLDSGVVRQEEQLGILYNQSPDDIDDLKLIKGVANVLEEKLHNSDVFRFKQIALWTDTAAREFGAKLSFRDRIFRDDWIAQAKQFHEEKYGEKL